MAVGNNTVMNNNFQMNNNQQNYGYPNMYYGGQQYSYGNQQYQYGGQQYQYGNQPYTSNQQLQQQVYCRPVTSEEEAKAAIIELDGSLYIFTCLNQGKIYTKQLEMDGNAPLRTYELVGFSTNQIPVSTSESEVKKDIEDLYAMYEKLDKEVSLLSDDFDMYLNEATKNSKKEKNDKK